MKLETATKAVLAAADAQDLDALQVAGRMRAVAIRSLGDSEPTEALRESIAASVAAGEVAKRVIHRIRQGMRKESRRLANIEVGFLRAVEQQPHIDFRG